MYLGLKKIIGNDWLWGKGSLTLKSRVVREKPVESRCNIHAVNVLFTLIQHLWVSLHSGITIVITNKEKEVMNRKVTKQPGVRHVLIEEIYANNSDLVSIACPVKHGV